MNADKVGKLFRDANGHYWQLESYCEHPTATFCSLGGGRQKISGAVGSLNLEGLQEVNQTEERIVRRVYNQLDRPISYAFTAP